jgi:hypothetical protein
LNLLKFWPTEADCLACIKPEAENPSDAVFLAVHQEMRLFRKSFTTGISESKSQRQFINEFLTENPGSGCVILPILGESGIGKSHLVRWLGVQLRQLGDPNSRHVITIPKGASLKSVLGRILGDLKGTKYERIRKQLQSAREQMDDISAKQRVRAELLTAIERKYKDAQAKLTRSKSAGEKIGPTDELWLKHGDPRKLPALFSDTATQNLFMLGTSQRAGIISELARHVTKDTSETDAPRRQFEPQDFQVPKELEVEIHQDAGPPARAYLLNNLLKSTNPKSLMEAVELLNSIVDDAIAPLATPQDTSLSELFYDVRRLLLADGRELVLLVEDFAVLAGVQKALLDAIIRDGEVHGKKEACIIRTALAVTDGYFGNLETVKTRAVHGWWIENGDNDDEARIENQIGDFVATYVNAARLGVERLESFYGKNSNGGKKAPDAVEVIGVEEEESILLNGFGKSANGYTLFPFNPSAIQTIAHWKLRRNDRLRFHPRSIISEVILPVLKEYRTDFERGEFPPEQFLGYRENLIDADLTTEIGKRVSETEKRRKYLYLLEFWGDRPRRIAEAKIPKAIYEAFGLDPLDGRAAGFKTVELKPIVQEGGSRQSLSATSKSDVQEREVQTDDASYDPPQVKELLDRVNAWRSGGTLGQNDANKIRQWINSHLLNSVNWESELLRPITPETDTYARRIYLPNAKGNPPDIDKAFIVVATDDQFQDAAWANRLYKAIRAMARYSHYNGWSYNESDSDYIEVANFVELYLEPAVSWVRTHYKNLDGDPIPVIAQALLWQSRILNIESAHRVDDSSCLDAICAPAPDASAEETDQDWRVFVEQMSTRRGLLQAELLERIGAFQGKSKDKPHAIDVVQILDTLQGFRKLWIVGEEFPKLPTNPTDELRQIHQHITELARFGTSKVEDRRKTIVEQSKQIVGELGADYDKNELIRDLLEVCDLSEQYDLDGNVTTRQVRELIEAFRTAKAKEVGEQVEVIMNKEDFGTRMTAIARLDIQTLAFMKRFTEVISQFLKERSGKASGKILDWNDEVVETAKQQVDSILNELESVASNYTETSS